MSDTEIPHEPAYCQYRAETDGCTEWSCMYHGDINRNKFKAHKLECSEH